MLKNNLFKDIEDKIHYPTLDDISIVNKEGEDLSSELQELFKKAIDKYYNHSKFQEYTMKKLFDFIVYGEVYYSEEDIDNLIKEIDNT